MSAAVPQISLDGHVVLSLGDLKEAVREVLREEGVLKTMKATKWDRTPKPPEDLLAARARICDLVTNNLVITLKDLDQDREIFRLTNIYTHLQFWRFVDQHLLRNDPPGPGEFATFTLYEGKKRYLTNPVLMHCAILKAGRGREKRQKGTIAATLKLYGVTRCLNCGWKKEG